MFNDIEKTQFALANVESLAFEVEQGLFMPKRFRHLNAEQWRAARPEYVKYLRDEAASLRKRMTEGGKRKFVVTANA